jgi:DNA-binding LytR/AlgR family response regulator
VGLRKLVMWTLGGDYDFRLSLATVLYEFRKDVVTCLLIGGGMWLIERVREAQQPQAPAASVAESSPAAPHMVWLRDGTTRIRIEPRDIVWISSAGNYVEYSLADGTSHLIRGTLASAETQLARFNVARIHRTRLANLGRVTGMEMKPSGDFELTFDTGQTAMGSRRYRGAVASLDRSATSS